MEGADDKVVSFDHFVEYHIHILLFSFSVTIYLISKYSIDAFCQYHYHI